MPENRLETQRLVLEPLKVQHAAAFLEYWIQNRSHFQPWEPARAEIFYTLRHQESSIAQSQVDAERGLLMRFAVFERDGPAIVANVNLWEIRRGVAQSAIIGYSVAAAREGRGYATEAAGAVVRYAFDTLNLHRLETSYQPQNERSGRVLRKLGFVVEGYAQDYRLFDGKWRDGILVGLTNPLWRNMEEA